MRKHFRPRKQDRFIKRLKRMKSQRDVAGLTAALVRSDDSDAVLFASALGELGDSSAAEPLLRRLRRIDLSTPTSDNSNKVAWAVIAEALGQLATPGGVAQTGNYPAARPDLSVFV
jgi:hypothetical protein